MRPSIFAALLAASGILVSSCSSTYLREGSAPRPMPSFDGLYSGSIRIRNVSSSSPRDWCETTPTMRIEVRNNGFNYAMSHPNVMGNPSPVYSAYIYPDGSIRSVPGIVAGIVTGQATGNRMEGAISGLGCEYAFVSKERVSGQGIWKPHINARAEPAAELSIIAATRCRPSGLRR